MVRKGLRELATASLPAGQIPSRSFTAHPKVDLKSKELVCWGTQTKGPGTKDCCHFALDSDGKKTEECWFKNPFCGFLHDAGVSEDYVALMLVPMPVDIEEMKKDGSHYTYDHDLDLHWGLVPRRGSDASKGQMEVGPDGEVEKVFVETVLAYGNVLPFFPEENRKDSSPAINDIKIQLVRFA
ncbi:Carotenoid oxygenase [Penicillium griseofulvum]|uniref:Carotenoid oxygenase n=1 Tax=Penicillium patulum TaxID=5078 RepID=A0A135LD62_PENPA|nr:Carotenoid oxygenase [Penicillium griseofulvum]KXG46904.1 Carotenoid oxygenase [Penicillium griseofulvum]